jgi:hypothetical protein
VLIVGMTAFAPAPLPRRGRDDYSAQEIAEFDREGRESYLFDDEPLRALCEAVGKPDMVPAVLEAKRQALEASVKVPWELMDLRKTCATYDDVHVPESSVEILGHSGGVTYRHYAHRAPLAFKAIMTLPQPTAFSGLLNGCDGECPCCQRRFADAA